jgi:hypothetical protein
MIATRRRAVMRMMSNLTVNLNPHSASVQTWNLDQVWVSWAYPGDNESVTVLALIQTAPVQPGRVVHPKKFFRERFN